MQVIATAGHVDHGKSALVRALTGTDPDRWEEERRRGLTIDLGFAWMTLPSGEQLAFVDVPGHERFVPNMLAGIGPVPAVLFVVAADEGWMPQSAEHLAALDALGVRHGVLVVTRADLADPGPAAADAARRIAATSLGPVEAVAVSSVTGEGLPKLIAVLDQLAASLPTADPGAPARLWVDRSFSITGSGTVVTGTLQAGTIRADDELVLTPSMRPVRVRGIQSLGQPVTAVTGVTRVALNLRGISQDSVSRGMALVQAGRWTLTDVIDVRLSQVAGLETVFAPELAATASPARPDRPAPDSTAPDSTASDSTAPDSAGAASTVAVARGSGRRQLARRRSWHGGSWHGRSWHGRSWHARGRSSGGSAFGPHHPAAHPDAARRIGPHGGQGPAAGRQRDHQAQPVRPGSAACGRPDPAARPGRGPAHPGPVRPGRDRSRAAAPGAGRRGRARRRAAAAGPARRGRRRGPATRLLARAAHRGASAAPPRPAAGQCAAGDGRLRAAGPVCGEWLADPAHWAELTHCLAEALTDHAARAPLAPGLTLEAARAALRLPDRRLVEALVKPPLTVSDGIVYVAVPAGLPGAPALPTAVRSAVRVIRAELAAAPFAAPEADRLRRLGLDIRAIAAAERAGMLLRISDQIVLAPGADGAAARILAGLPQPFTAAQARQALETTRRVVIPLLEYLDRAGVTERLPDDRRKLKAASNLAPPGPASTS